MGAPPNPTLTRVFGGGGRGRGGGGRESEIVKGWGEVYCIEKRRRYEERLEEVQSWKERDFWEWENRGGNGSLIMGS